MREQQSILSVELMGQRTREQGPDKQARARARGQVNVECASWIKQIVGGPSCQRAPAERKMFKNTACRLHCHQGPRRQGVRKKGAAPSKFRRQKQNERQRNGGRGERDGGAGIKQSGIWLSELAWHHDHDPHLRAAP